MPAANNPRTARVVLTVTRDTRHFVNVFHMSRQDGAVLNLADLTNMVNVIADWWLNSYRHSCKPAVVGFTAVATKQDPADPQQATAFLAAPGDDANVNSEAANVTGAVSWRTGLAGRKFRGRFFHFGPATNEINANDTFTGGFLALVTGEANYLLSHLATAALNAIIFHAVDNTFTTINSIVFDQNSDSQRRRLAGRGQ